MKKRILSDALTLLSIILVLGSTDTFGWGFWAHKEIHRYAIRSLPEEMKSFFTLHSDTIIARSADADNRRYSDIHEGFYHFIDIDRYGPPPFKELPHDYAQAVAKFGKSRVDSNGTLPWRIAEFTKRLSDAMKEKDRDAIVFYSANLGHYVADAHVPLHATENYDGQLTHQEGIHSRWESQLPERFGEKYSFGFENVEYIKDPLEFAFDIVFESHAMVDSVLKFDVKAREGMPVSELFAVRIRKGKEEYEYSEKYYMRYHNLLNGMVERRLKQAVKRVASYWYSAWVDAGKPDLSAPR